MSAVHRGDTRNATSVFAPASDAVRGEPRVPARSLSRCSRVAVCSGPTAQSSGWRAAARPSGIVWIGVVIGGRRAEPVPGGAACPHAPAKIPRSADTAGATAAAARPPRRGSAWRARSRPPSAAPSRRDATSQNTLRGADPAAARVADTAAKTPPHSACSAGAAASACRCNGTPHARHRQRRCGGRAEGVWPLFVSFVTFWVVEIAAHCSRSPELQQLDQPSNQRCGFMLESRSAFFALYPIPRAL